MAEPKKWQDDDAFVAWLKTSDYVLSDGRPLLSPSALAYMWEAFRGGRGPVKASVSGCFVKRKEKGES